MDLFRRVGLGVSRSQRQQTALQTRLTPPLQRHCAATGRRPEGDRRPRPCHGHRARFNASPSTRTARSSKWLLDPDLEQEFVCGKLRVVEDTVGRDHKLDVVRRSRRATTAAIVRAGKPNAMDDRLPISPPAVEPQSNRPELLTGKVGRGGGCHPSRR